MNKAIAVILFFIPVYSFSQILNIDKSDTSAYAVAPKFNINFGSGLEIDKQKTTVYDATNTLESMLQKNRNLFILAGSYRFTYNGPDDILNAGYIHLRYRYNYKSLFQPEPFIQYQWDNKRGIEHRFVTGMNCRYNFFKGDTWDINAGLGLMYEEEIWDYVAVNDSSLIPPNPQPVTSKLLKANSYLRFDIKTSDNSTIAFSLFIQSGFSALKPRFAPHFQWDIGAGKHLSFSISFSGLYDTNPVVPIDKFYYSLSNSLLLKF